MKSWSFKIKLGALCAFLMFSIVVIGITGLRSTDKVAQQVFDLGETQLPAVRNMTLADMMHDGLRAVTFRSLYLSELNDPEQKKEVAEELKEMSTNIKKYVENISNLRVREDTKKSIEDAHPEIEAYVKSAEEIVSLALAGKKDLAVQKLDYFQKSFSALEKKLEFLGELIEKDADSSRELAKEISESSKRTSLILMLVGVVLGLVTSIWFTISLSDTLTKITVYLSESASQVTSASTQIAVSSRDLSDSAVKQSASLEETSTALEEISAMIAKAADGAEITFESSSDSHKKAEEGREAADRMLSSMDEISQSNDAIMQQITVSNQHMSDIVKVIQEIGNRTKVINEIVFQTKLLSFNASVEAARAGEHGKGFAVVAEEVGNLAQMSGNAAKEISDMLDGSISQVEQIVRETKSKVDILMSSGRAKVESGMDVARQCSELLNEIVKNVSRAAGLSQDISVATKEQSQGVSEINKAMSQLDSITHKNSSSSQETASAAAQLSEQAHSLKQVVEELEAIVQGASENHASQNDAPNEKIEHLETKAKKIPLKLSA